MEKGVEGADRQKQTGLDLTIHFAVCCFCVVFPHSNLNSWVQTPDAI